MYVLTVCSVNVTNRVDPIEVFKTGTAYPSRVPGFSPFSVLYIFLSAVFVLCLAPIVVYVSGMSIVDC
jgi:hypothetical protein